VGAPSWAGRRGSGMDTHNLRESLKDRDRGRKVSGSWLRLHGFLGHVDGTIPVRARSQARKEASTNCDIEHAAAGRRA
jgi:hypothetical protein